MGVALRTIAEDGDLLVDDQVQIGVGVMTFCNFLACPRAWRFKGLDRLCHG
jgi:hypothetical protein